MVLSLQNSCTFAEESRSGASCGIGSVAQAFVPVFSVPPMKQLVEDIAKALVDSTDEVVVREVTGERVAVLELRVAPSVSGK